MVTWQEFIIYMYIYKIHDSYIIMIDDVLSINFLNVHVQDI